MQGFVLCGSAPFQAAGPGIFDVRPGKVRLGAWSNGPAPGTSPRLLICQPLAEQGWFVAGVCHLLSRTLQLQHEVPGMAWHGGSAQGCALVPCVPVPGRAGSSLGAAAVPGAAQAGQAWGGCSGKGSACTGGCCALPVGSLGQTRCFWGCPLRGSVPTSPFGDQHLLLPVKPALSLPELSGELSEAAPGGFTPGKDPALCRS